MENLLMSLKEHPTELFEENQLIENKYQFAGIDVAEEDVIANVLKIIPKEYKGIVTAERRANGDKFLLDWPQRVYGWLLVSSFWQVRHDDNADDEVQLFGDGCYHCKKFGAESKWVSQKEQWQL